MGGLQFSQYYTHTIIQQGIYLSRVFIVHLYVDVNNHNKRSTDYNKLLVCKNMGILFFISMVCFVYFRYRVASQKHNIYNFYLFHIYHTSG